MRFPALSLLLASCSFSTEIPDPNAMGEAGVASDGMQVQADATPLDGCTTFSTVVDTCNVGAYGPGMSINGMRRYNTDTHELSDDNGSNATTPMFRETMIGGNPITLLVVDGFTIQSMARLRVTGSRAFGIVSTGTISITGTLDGTAAGAGARTAMVCDDFAGEPGRSNNQGSGGGSGGGGGGYREVGGRGGTGDNNGAQLAGGDGGEKANLAPTIIGGCPGGRGGNQMGGGTGGDGGGGGAGIFLTSAMTIGVGGAINVGGGGGKLGTAADGGGGGGGSGGMILVEAPAVTVTGTLAANGGSGGAGSGNLAGTDGGSGLAASGSAPVGQAATGGGGGGGDGGAGGSNGQNNGQQPANANGGAGGGGGGVGFISVKSLAQTITGTVSPSTTPWP